MVIPVASKKSVVVVESPAKAKTIEKYLGTGYKVLASYGHVRDLPKSRLGIDVENDYKPDYIIPRASGKQVKALTKELEKANSIYLATDYDREGEAIAWHIQEAIPPQKGQDVKRITFTEITKEAVSEALKHPRELDRDLIDAQQARRVLDRLVGYSLSPVLWRKVKSGLSAGRVQSVAVKLIVDREREIKEFKPEEYWTIAAELKAGAGQFVAKLVKIGGKKADQVEKKLAQQAEKDLSRADYRVSSYEQKPVSRNPFPPFITSSLQQDASRRLGFTARRTMRAAQWLYESGHITYMRTDSFTISAQAQHQIVAEITKQFGKNYAEARQFKKKVRGAQEAHEAIRVTDASKQAGDLALDGDQSKLYDLIWKRTLASQMAPAKYLRKTITVEAGSYELRASAEEMQFDGFSKVYQVAQEDDEDEEQTQKIPPVEVGENLDFVKLLKEQHFTTPPPRYNEASLIKKLEEEGIGRPSTYAPTISTIVDRGYIQREGRQLVPQDTGFWVTDLLSKHFPDVVNVKFTAEIEDGLDDIAEGKTAWQPVVRSFYQPLEKRIQTEQIEKIEIPVIETDEVCDKCGKTMVIKTGRFGEFMACSGYPECKNAKPLAKKVGLACPKDGGDIIEKKTRKGRVFYGCSNYPNCDYASWTKPTEASLNAK